jgi:hypothetical protein
MPFPLYPQKRTSVERSAMSALCQKQTFCAAVYKAAIRSPRRSFLVEHEFQFCRLLNR